LANYSAIRDDPYSNMNNLVLNVVDEISTELKHAFGDKKVLLVSR
jgi:hypothetical protein